jgi:isoquinoline 1-oxidoreductase subunit alpha
MITLNVNGKSHLLDVSPEMPLLWAIRDKLNLTGTKFGCEAAGKRITTIEGISGPVAEAVTHAWQSLDVVQCGYCQSGQIMSAIVLLNENKNPTDEDINLGMEGNICRCGTYVRIRRAIHQAAKALA